MAHVTELANRYDLLICARRVLDTYSIEIVPDFCMIFGNTSKTTIEALHFLFLLSRSILQQVPHFIERVFLETRDPQIIHFSSFHIFSSPGSRGASLHF